MHERLPKVLQHLLDLPRDRLCPAPVDIFLEVLAANVPSKLAPQLVRDFVVDDGGTDQPRAQLDTFFLRQIADHHELIQCQTAVDADDGHVARPVLFDKASDEALGCLNRLFIFDDFEALLFKR